MTTRYPKGVIRDPALSKECCVACGLYVRADKGSWRRNWLGAKEFICDECKEASDGNERNKDRPQGRSH